MSKQDYCQRLKEIEERRKWYADESIKLIPQIDDTATIMKIYTIVACYFSKENKPKTI